MVLPWRIQKINTSSVRLHVGVKVLPTAQCIHRLSNSPCMERNYKRMYYVNRKKQKSCE